MDRERREYGAGGVDVSDEFDFLFAAGLLREADPTDGRSQKREINTISDRTHSWEVDATHDRTLALIVLAPKFARV